MTRKSKRELERAVEDLGTDGPHTVREWLDRRLVTDYFEADAEVVVHDSDGSVVESPAHDGEVCLYRAVSDVGPSVWIDEATVPDWIDVEEDLPVEP